MTSDEEAEKRSAQLIASISSPGSEPASVDNPRSFVGKYEVARQCLPDFPRDIAIQIALSSTKDNLVSAIRRYNRDITAGFVEMVASSQGVHNDIWSPYEQSNEYMRVSEDEIAEARAAATRRRMANKNKNRSSGDSASEIAA